MSVNCAKCKKNVANDYFECPSCNGFFHPGCAAATASFFHGRSIQICKKCATEESKKKMNSPRDTSSGSRVDSQDNNPEAQISNAQLASLIQSISAQVSCLPDLTKKVDNIESQMSEISQIKKDLAEINSNLSNFIKKCKANSEKIEALDLDVKAMDLRVTKLESSKANSISPDDRDAMKRDLEFSMNRAFEIVIFGLSLTLLKNKSSTMPKIAEKLSLQFEDWHVSFTREIRTTRGGTNLLLVHFVSPVFKVNWLKTKRRHGDMKCNDIEPGQPDNLVYINQRETVEERRFFFEAKKIAKSQNYAACWMTDGKIYFRKTQDGRPFVYTPQASDENDENMDIPPQDEQSVVD